MSLSYMIIFFSIEKPSKSTAMNTTERPIQRNQRKNKRIALDDITNLATREFLTNCTPTPPSDKRRCVLGNISYTYVLAVFVHVL